jgi:peptidase M28-like protein
MKRAAFLLGGALLMLAMALKGELLSLPDPPAKTAAGQFDTGRALARLERILGEQRPHPVDSAANDAVRARLLAELRGLGLRPAVDDHFTCNGPAKGRSIACARIRNVTATIGPAGGSHVLLASHYDSTPAGPGASDDGIGMAAMLETAALLKDRPLRRPVTFLFDEGEETGLIGARAFLEHDPLAARVDSLINLESRGVTGPAIMFETGGPKGAAISAFARSSTRPVANSATADFYRLIPNSTDVAVFAERPWAILNFAVIGNETRYHSPGDTLAALDRRSVAHIGDQVLAAARALASAPLPPAGGDRLYADILGRRLLTIPAEAGFPLLGGLILLFAWLGRQRRGGLRRAAGTVAAALLGSTAFAFLAQALLGLLRPGAYWRAYPEATGAGVYVTAAAAGLIAILCLARPLARDRLRASFWLIFLGLGASIGLAAPGALIFFLFPPLVAGAGMILERRWPGAETAAAWLAWILLFLSWGPLLHLTEILLDFDAAWSFAPFAALILFPALIELKPLATRLPARPLLALSAAAAVFGWTPAALAPAYSADRKQEFGIEYAWHATDKEGQWMVVHDGGPLPAAFHTLGRFRRGVEVPWSTRKRWAVAAPPIPIEPPALEHLGERKEGSDRLVSLRLRTNGAETVRLRLKPDSRLSAVKAGGWARRFGRGKADEDFVFRCHGRSCDGLRVDLTIGSPAQVEAILMGVRSGLPEAGRMLVAARPAYAAPQYSADSSIAMRRVRF